ncbi:hypothetical protein PCANC_19957 [Puccinia coronata f. sp. avenae]|uniref:Uncharacterized protein n=1 Tax=Puccinia coronata f. sp. avenae TaxID=200324 RepID=A0A2N5SKW7_9BASI|nr:hypothetical protein PCANC_19957 [Puccinia coronata f. sp. avenae]
MWPPKLDLGGEFYTLMAQGYWNGGHYYCKVVRKSGGVIGVWLHNNMEHGGNAQLIGAKPEAIDYVNKKIQGVAKDNPNCTGDIPFQHLSALLSQPENSVGQTGTTEVLETSLLGGLDSNLDSKDHLGSSNESDHSDLESSSKSFVVGDEDDKDGTSKCSDSRSEIGSANRSVEPQGSLKDNLDTDDGSELHPPIVLWVIPAKMSQEKDDTVDPIQEEKKAQPSQIRLVGKASGTLSAKAGAPAAIAGKTLVKEKRGKRSLDGYRRSSRIRKS